MRFRQLRIRSAIVCLSHLMTSMISTKQLVAADKSFENQRQRERVDSKNKPLHIFGPIFTAALLQPHLTVAL